MPAMLGARSEKFTVRKIGYTVFGNEENEVPIEFEGLGFKLKGAAGEIVLWMLCFLAISGAIRLLSKR